MSPRHLPLLLAAWLAGCAGQAPNRVPDAAPPAERACASTATRPAADPRIRQAIAEARRQHAAFGGQTIGLDGRLLRLGAHEAGAARPGGEPAAWQRVAQFWLAVPSRESLGLASSAGRVPLARLLPALEEAEPAVREAVQRAAIIDTPWSAAFISHLMQAAGFAPREFAFSDSHVDYVQAALAQSAAEDAGASTPHVFRACDAATTPARPGDLLCATRAGTAGITRLAELRAALAERPPGLGFPMHCDLVVSVDAPRRLLETVGGNVADSVTLARLRLDGRGVLDPAWRRGAEPRPGCTGADAQGAGTCAEHLSRRPWLVLLQLRH